MFTKISAFSKEVTPGTLFVAKGRGYDFIGEAIANGASGILTEKPYDSADIPVIITENIDKVAKEYTKKIYGEPAKKLICIGVTGTNGKTTTASMIQHLIGDTCGLIGTIEYKIGKRSIPARLTTPDYFQMQTLLFEMVRAGCKYCVMEASSHALDQKRLENIDFKAAVFTNLSQDHLDYHGTMENYFLAKKKLFDQLEFDAFAIINRDDPKSKEIAKNCRAKVVDYGPNEWEAVQHHNAYNLGAALAVCEALKIGTKPLEGYQLPKGRFEAVPNDRNVSIIVDFAHTPDALKAVLNSVKKPVTLVFGCGGERDKEKRAQMGKVASQAESVIITSDNPRGECPKKICNQIAEGLEHNNYTVCVDRRLAIERAIDRAESGSTIVIAGRGHEKFQKIGDEEIPFDDVKVARCILER